MKNLFIFFVAFFLYGINSEAQAPWNLPIDLSDSNTTVNFELGSTWHTVHGKTSNINGNISLDNPDNYSSIKGYIELPVENFDTDNRSRDERLREIMLIDKFKTVRVDFIGTESLSSPETLKLNEEYEFIVLAKIKILGTTKEIKINTKVKKELNRFIVTGDAIVEWIKFGVEDPSIFIASVEPFTKIRFKIEI